VKEEIPTTPGERKDTNMLGFQRRHSGFTLTDSLVALAITAFLAFVIGPVLT